MPRDSAKDPRWTHPHGFPVRQSLQNAMLLCCRLAFCKPASAVFDPSRSRWELKNRVKELGRTETRQGLSIVGSGAALLPFGLQDEACMTAPDDTLLPTFQNRWRARLYRPLIPGRWMYPFNQRVSVFARSARIEGRTAIHDRHHFEITFRYSFAETSPTQYRIDAFFFIPAAAGVDAASYDPAHFFGDTKAYIRLETPKVSLGTIMEDSLASPLLDVEGELRPGVAHVDSAAISRKARVAGCIIRGIVRRQFRKLMQVCNDDTVACPEVAHRIAEMACNTRTLLKRTRRTWKMATDAALGNGFDHIDDFLSGECLEASCETLLIVDERIRRHSEATDSVRDARAALAGFVSEELAYRTSRGWPITEPTSTYADLEAVLYRRSQLKNYLFGSLFLKARALKSRDLANHIFGAAGVLIAAIWAFFSNPALFGTVTINSLTFAVLFVAVFAYILKDRLKEMVRQYLAGRFGTLLADRDRQILSSDLMDEKPQKPLGRMREFINFVTPSKVGNDIHKLRNAVHTIGVGEDAIESILHYAKLIDLKPQRPWVYRNGIRDILRFNVRHLLTGFDESIEHLYAFDLREQCPTPIEGHHVYHVNLILRYTVCDFGGKPAQTSYERIRLVLNKHGIVRIEPVVLDTQQEQLAAASETEDDIPRTG